MIVILLQLLNFISSWFPRWVSKAVKWVFHRITGQSEIQRTVDLVGTSTATKVLTLERALKHSRYPSLNGIANAVSALYDDHVKTIIEVKRLPESFSGEKLTSLLRKIVSLNNVRDQVESVKNTPFSEDDHTKHLETLWSFAYPNARFQRTGEAWKEIGFQGTDPCTDFRGMGLLGLEQLVFLTQNHEQIAKRIFSLSNHPKFGFPYAITGINVTALTVRCLENHSLKTHLYNLESGEITMNDFNNLYCYIFENFANFYFKAEPENIMQFNVYLKKFEQTLVERLNGDLAYVLKFESDS